MNWSQSLWVRDRFLIRGWCDNLPAAQVAIPLGQGQVFNESWSIINTALWKSQSLWVRDRFLIAYTVASRIIDASQSLWVRDRFLMDKFRHTLRIGLVAIPLGQGQVFNCWTGR